MSWAIGRASAVLATLLLLARGRLVDVATAAAAAHKLQSDSRRTDNLLASIQNLSGTSVPQTRHLLQAFDGPSTEPDQNASSSRPAWACPSGSNITEASRTAILAQPCVAAVGFPGKLRCGDVMLASPKLVLDVQFNLCTRIEVRK